MATQGSSFIDFGAFPGTDTATATITGQASILATSLVEVWASFDASLSDVHTEDELQMLVGYVRFAVPKTLIVAATGFTVTAVCDDGSRMWGRIPFNWVWN